MTAAATWVPAAAAVAAAADDAETIAAGMRHHGAIMAWHLDFWVRWVTGHGLLKAVYTVDIVLLRGHQATAMQNR